MWIACAALNATVLANWLLLEYAQDASCGQAVAVMCGIVVVAACLFVAKFTRDMTLPENNRREAGYTATLILPPILALMATVVLGTVRLCGARNLSALVISMPAIVALVGGFVILILCSCGMRLNHSALRCFVCLSWIFELAAVACVTLFILKLDAHACFNWAFVAAPFAVSVTSFVGALYFLGGHFMLPILDF